MSCIKVTGNQLLQILFQWVVFSAFFITLIHVNFKMQKPASPKTTQRQTCRIATGLMVGLLAFAGARFGCLMGPYLGMSEATEMNMTSEVCFRSGPGQPNQRKVSQTKERSAHELFTGAFRNKSSM